MLLTAPVVSSFKKKHLQTYGFYYNNKEIILDSLEVEAIENSIPRFQFKPNNLNEISKKN